MLSKEEVESVKKQLLKQIENLPEEQRSEIENQLESMSDKEFEEFLKKNKLIGEENKNPGGGCTFCLLAQDKFPTYKVSENSDGVAILELNPISKGHVIIIPKKHLEAKKMPPSLKKLSEEVSKKINSELKPKKIEVAISELFGHGIVNIIPIYNEETDNFNGERKKASEEELKEIQSKLSSLKTTKTPKTKEKKETKAKANKPKKTKGNVDKEKPNKGEVDKEKSSKGKFDKENHGLSLLPKAPVRIP